MYTDMPLHHLITYNLTENIFQESELIATLPAGQDPTVISISILPSAFLTIGGRFVATMEDVRLSMGQSIFFVLCLPCLKLH